MEEPIYNPDKYKWGFLYFDPKDYRVFVPKNVRWMGYTVNFANPFTYLILISIVVIALIMGRMNG